MNLFDKIKLKSGLYKRKVLLDTFIRVFSTDDGKVVLAQICKENFIFDTTFVKGDPQQTALNEGRRQVAIGLLKFVNKNPDTLLKQLEQQIQQYEDSK